MSEAFASRPVRIVQPMPPAPPQRFAGAVWIAALDERELATGEVTLDGVAPYPTARLLVRRGRVPRGFVEVPVIDGAVDVGAAARKAELLPPARVPSRVVNPAISVVLCTYDRPVLLADALRSLLSVSYPEFEVVVVDNHPQSGLTAPVVRAIADDRMRLVSEAQRGLARARNTGTQAAQYSYVAFTDDDVVVDENWLHGIADGFLAGPDVACVTGIVPSGEIDSPAQAYFDRRVSWATRCEPDVYSLSDRRRLEPLFPFQVGRFGTGANFAVRKQTLLELGGFDEALGVGGECGGGEDIDLFVRVILAGHQLAYEPAALVWHKHRRELEHLVKQISDYGVGLGAWMTKLASHPPTLRMMLARLLPGLLHLRRITKPVMPDASHPAEHNLLSRVERRAVLSGPAALIRARRAGARSRPLSPPSPAPRSMEDVR